MMTVVNLTVVAIVAVANVIVMVVVVVTVGDDDGEGGGDLMVTIRREIVHQSASQCSAYH
jgi:hypothetical protein